MFFRRVYVTNHAFKRWAERYRGDPIAMSVEKAVFKSKPADNRMIRRKNPGICYRTYDGVILVIEPIDNIACRVLTVMKCWEEDDSIVIDNS